ncbi:alpha/beta fold hydrolase [Fulvivirgaceae bacterium BMA10]|uniref:Alpha/beta fold hydrolase n=1 Tax=Splendidivirga corallicola TaxID=3051826 RepID=A0ABT8KLF2_9BACT|nr:alpha/beta fold hydrolase [Fulvivirgaceae bacterium BMA10]
MNLFYREFGEGDPIIILHGLFGASDNWMSVAKQLANNYKIYLVDQRNHGNSFKSDVFNYQVMADDLFSFIRENQIKEPILLGHSMGGKVSMKFSIQYPDLLKKLIVVDISPRAYPIHHQEILEGLSAIDLTQTKSRGEADRILQNYVPELGIRQFLLKNLSRLDGERFEWKINLPVIRKEIDLVGEGIDQGIYPGETLFVKGAKSDYIQEIDLPLMKSIFPDHRLETIDGAGHWVHAEQPVRFLETVQHFVKN